MQRCHRFALNYRFRVDLALVLSGSRSLLVAPRADGLSKSEFDCYQRIDVGIIILVQQLARTTRPTVGVSLE